MAMTTAGVLLLALILYDVYATILRATKRLGPISETLNRSLWWMVRRVAQNFGRRWRHRLLTAVGPLLLPTLLALLVLLLIVGFALIYLPRLATGFHQDDAAKAAPEWLQAFYFSGLTLFTIGYGDIVPRAGAMRITAVLEGFSGIALISLGVTYLLTVYGALERKRAVALNFYHQARQGADAAGLIAGRFARGQFYGLTDELKIATRDLQALLETHLEHPVIHYFHPLEVYKSMPRALFVMLETTALMRSCLQRENYVEAGDHPDVLIAAESARYVLAELITSLRLEKHARAAFESEMATRQRREKCFRRAKRRLARAQIVMRPAAQALRDYSADRDGWERQLYHFAEFLGYDWDEITGDRSLEDATDDEITERHESLQIAAPAENDAR